LRQDWVARLLLAFVVVGALSLPIGIAMFHNMAGPRSFVYQVALLLNFVTGYLILRKLEDVDLFIRAFVASIGAMALPLSIYLLQAGILEDVHGFHNSDALKASIYGWPNGFSILVVVAFVMCLYVISTATTRLVRRAYLVLAVGLGACVILTFSKTGWVALAIALWPLWLRRWSLWRQLLLVAGLAATLFVLQGVNGNFRDTIFTVGTGLERVRILVVVLRHMNPIILLTGSGSQNVQALLAPYANEEVYPGVSLGTLSAHDELLNVLVKTGLLGLVLLVAALVSVTLRTRRLGMSADARIAKFSHYWYAVSWAVIASLFTVDELHYWPVGAVYWLMAGVMVHMLASPEAQSELDAVPRDRSSPVNAPHPHPPPLRGEGRL
jgi:putative inorganic carbon (HCO3(-)) transporter